MVEQKINLYGIYKKQELTVIESPIEKKAKEYAFSPQTEEALFAYYESIGVNKSALIAERAKYETEYKKNTHYSLCLTVLKNHFYTMYRQSILKKLQEPVAPSANSPISSPANPEVK